MMYEISPERDLTLIPVELGGQQGLDCPPDLRYEKCGEEHAHVFTLYGFEYGHKRDERVIKRFKTKVRAERHANHLCSRPEHKYIRSDSHAFRQNS